MIIGITGTDGAGKGTVVEYLVTKKGFTHYSSRSIIVAELEAQGRPIDRNNMRLIANELRAEHGDDFIVQKAFEHIKADECKRAVVESIRALAEAKTLKSTAAVLLAVDADVSLRYARVQERRSETDKVDFETFVAHEELEKNDPDPHGMQKAKVIEMADYTIFNNGTLAELQAATDLFLAQYDI